MTKQNLVTTDGHIMEKIILKKKRYMCVCVYIYIKISIIQVWNNIRVRKFLIDRIVIFGWTIPLRLVKLEMSSIHYILHIVNQTTESYIKLWNVITIPSLSEA